jgi:ATP-binding protein involved in chromosome partitioning
VVYEQPIVVSLMPRRITGSRSRAARYPSLSKFPDAALCHIAQAPQRRKPLKTNAWFPLQLRYNVRPQASVGGPARKILPNTPTGNVTLSTDSDVKNFISSIELPEIGRKLGDVGRVAGLRQHDGHIEVDIELGFPAASLAEQFGAAVVSALAGQSGTAEVRVGFSTRVVAHGVQRNLKPLPAVRNIIAIASGKGGVGKSTVAVNVALALAAEGAAVGLLDADIYGPSQPQMVGLAGKQPESSDGKTMQPMQAHGLQVMSIGFLVDPDQPMIWRGPMVTSALNQLLHQTNWHDLDYLIVDMPPGTGDIQLSLSQQVPVSGAVIVTTPQNIATLDARKGLAMFRKVSIPVLGIIENMSTHLCSNCGFEEPIFGTGGGELMAADFSVEMLGQLPLDARIREQTDSGRPTVIADPGSPAAQAYRMAALRMAAAQAAQGKDFSSKFPKIVIEES